MHANLNVFFQVLYFADKIPLVSFNGVLLRKVCV